MLPKLSPDQFLKLKQLTVLALSATNKILSYNELLEELEVCNVHELEDFLNNECVFAAGLPFFASATGNICNLQQGGISCMASLTWISSRNFKSPSRAFVSGKMLMVLAILVD
ncbi:uncharacterized protein [Populus alba]|uniref:uncharacterized protein isoform X3 n=1 Tax=Populus alba TaxID=43335 RepID=UPI003CC73D4E